VRTGSNSRQRELRPHECVEIFLISGSPEERGEHAEDVLKNQSARIILCSIQYVQHATETIDFIKREDFRTYIY
jgi:hypothetical protein